MPSPDNHSARFDWLTRWALFIAIVLVIVRATGLETLRDPFDVSPGVSPPPRALTAAASIVLDWLAFLPALLVLFRSMVDRAFRLARPISHVPAVLLAVWAGCSAIWSNDRFAAVVGSAHFLGGIALLWATTQLVRSWRDLRLVAGACFGLLLCLAASGLIYRFIDLPDLRQSVEKDWPTILQQRGWTADSFSAIQFHKKVMAGEAVGFTASANTFGAILALLLLVSLGLFVQRWNDRQNDRPNDRGTIAWPILIMIGFLIATPVLGFSRSRAAIAATFLGAVLFPIVIAFRSLLARRHALIFVASIIAIVVVGGGVMYLGVTHHIARDTLTFRWRYWVGSARIVRAHPIAGVGWNNFFEHYLAAREPVASEEVRDPHNIIVRFAAELGAIGALLAIAWLVMMFWQLTRPRATVDEFDPPPPSRALQRLMLIAGVSMTVNILASVDLSQDNAWVFISMLHRILYAGLILIGLIVATLKSIDRQELDDRPATFLYTGVIIALGMFLLCNAIDIAFFDSGAMWLFMMLAGAVMGMQLVVPEASRSSATLPRVGFATAIIGWLVTGAAIVWPVVFAEAKATTGDAQLAGKQPSEAAQSYLDAYSALPYSNADYLIRAARAMIYAQGDVDRFRQTIDRAIGDDPTSSGALSLAAHAEAGNQYHDTARMIAMFDRALKIDPYDVELRLEYADALRAANRPRESLEQFRLALAMNDQLGPDEPKRLPQARIDGIKSLMRALGG